MNCSIKSESEAMIYDGTKSRIFISERKIMRGVLTDKIQDRAVGFLGRTISQKELRLYPYIDYSVKNGCQGWCYDKLYTEEIKILNQLYEEKHITYSREKIIVTRRFYDYMQDVLAISYVEEFL